jgi:hypothetical protein
MPFQAEGGEPERTTASAPTFLNLSTEAASCAPPTPMMVICLSEGARLAYGEEGERRREARR